MEMRRLLWAVGLPIALSSWLTNRPGYSKEPRSAAEMHFDEAVLSPPMLCAFLQAMPKGAELHYHLTGGAYAENLIRSDANRGACIAVNKAEALARRLLVAAVSIATRIARSSAPPGPQSTPRAQRLGVVSAGWLQQLSPCLSLSAGIRPDGQNAD
jgi:hypothetical protein